MKITKELKFAIILTIILNVAFVCSGIVVAILGWTSPQLAVFITLFMFVYHTDVRIFIGLSFSKLLKHKIHVESKAFVVKKNEYNFLCRLGVKKWKDRFLAWDKSLFVLQKMDNARMTVVLQNNINAELTHWACAFVGLFAIPFGLLLSADEWAIYVITSVLASLFADLPPICIQRFNRYRLQQILKSQHKLNND